MVQEKLQGADILTYFSSRHEYTEQMVATVITQVIYELALDESNSLFRMCTVVELVQFVLFLCSAVENCKTILLPEYWYQHKATS